MEEGKHLTLAPFNYVITPKVVVGGGEEFYRDIGSSLNQSLMIARGNVQIT